MLTSINGKRRTVFSRYMQYSTPILCRNSSTTAGGLRCAFNSIPYTFFTNLFAQAGIEFLHTQNNCQPSKNPTQLSYLSSLACFFSHDISFLSHTDWTPSFHKTACQDYCTFVFYHLHHIPETHHQSKKMAAVIIVTVVKSYFTNAKHSKLFSLLKDFCNYQIFRVQTIRKKEQKCPLRKV